MRSQTASPRRGTASVPAPAAKAAPAKTKRPVKEGVAGTGTIVPVLLEVPSEPPAAPAPVRTTSALDAAARVLAETGRPMSCKELIGAMAQRGYWTSPGGKTPWATLYASLLRELRLKGDQARFVKVAAGRFARRGSV